MVHEDIHHHLPVLNSYEVQELWLTKLHKHQVFFTIHFWWILVDFGDGLIYDIGFTTQDTNLTCGTFERWIFWRMIPWTSHPRFTVLNGQRSKKAWWLNSPWTPRTIHQGEGMCSLVYDGFRLLLKNSSAPKLWQFCCSRPGKVRWWYRREGNRSSPGCEYHMISGPFFSDPTWPSRSNAYQHGRVSPWENHGDLETKRDEFSIPVGCAMCPSWKMIEFVNGKDDIPYEMEYKKCLKPPTSILSKSCGSIQNLTLPNTYIQSSAWKLERNNICAAGWVFRVSSSALEPVAILMAKRIRRLDWTSCSSHFLAVDDPHLGNLTSAGWWLTYPSEKCWSSSVGVTIPNIWKNKAMFQTINQSATEVSEFLLLESHGSHGHVRFAMLNATKMHRNFGFRCEDVDGANNERRHDRTWQTQADAQSVSQTWLRNHGHGLRMMVQFTGSTEMLGTQLWLADSDFPIYWVCCWEAS